MKKVLSISEIVQDLDRNGEPKELCASCEATYDESHSRLLATLDAFVRQVHHAGPDVCTRPDWLPRAETIEESIAWEEASDAAREIFRSWTRRVREAARLAACQSA